MQESDTDAVSVPRLDVWSHESAARSSGSVPRLLVLLNRVWMYCNSQLSLEMFDVLHAVNLAATLII